MINAIPTALSGMMAATERLAGAAGNLANQRSSGPLAPTAGKAPAYQPVVTVQRSAPGGGTIASYRPTSPPVVPAYEPDSPSADAAGLVAEPNVDVGREMTEMLSARQSYAANLKTMRIAAEMQDSLLKIVT
jgi:flagellar basal-body rod protein FlgC